MLGTNQKLSSEEEYKTEFISKVEIAMKTMTSKIPQFLNKIKSQQKENHGFHSRKCPLIVEKQIAFEKDVKLMIKNIKCRKMNNEF